MTTDDLVGLGLMPAAAAEFVVAAFRAGENLIVAGDHNAGKTTVLCPLLLLYVDALIYCRVSADRRNGRSVAEQEAECRAECERQGWNVVDVLTDNDRSASRHARKSRPAWDRVKQRVASGDVDVLVTWEASPCPA